MKQLTVTIYVPPATACRAGKSACGEISLTLSEADLARLSNRQRDGLARHLEGQGEWGARFFGAEATLEVLATEIDARWAAAEKNLLELEQRRRATEEEKLAARGRAAAELLAREAEIARVRLLPVADLVSVTDDVMTYRVDYSILREAGRLAECDKYRDDCRLAERSRKRALERALLLEVLPDLVDQHDAGLLSEDLVDDARRAHISRTLGIVTTGAARSKTRLDAIPPSCFSQYQALRARAEKHGATLGGIYATFRRAEHPEQGDDDGEVLDDERPVATVSLEVAGELATVKVPLF